MGEVLDYLLMLVIGFLEYPAWIIRYTVEHFLGQCTAVFVVTLLLQKMRDRMRSDRYSRLWKLLLVVGLLWGGFALAIYIPKFIDWYKEYLFLPSVLLAVVLAKLQLKLKLRFYLLLLGFLVVVVALAYAIMNPYYSPSNSYTKSNNPWAIDGMFEIHRWLTDQRSMEHKGGGGGGGGGMLGIIGSSGKADWNWAIFYSHGILLLVSAIAVPPCRLLLKMSERLSMNEFENTPTKTDESS